MIGVTYYKNGTAKAQVATNMSWTLINTGCDSQKLLPSPRNMFCLDSSTGVISTTAVFGQIQPEGDSTFILDIVILDSGIQQMNASTKVVIRISKNCTAGNSVYTQLITKCPPGRDGVKVSTENEEQTYKHTLLVQKSRTRLIGLEIDRMFFISSKVKVFMGEILTFNITYSTNSSQKSFETKQRLLFDPASSRETVWKILFEKEEVTDIDRTPVVIRILNHDGVGLSSFSHSIRLIVVLEKNYCNQSECCPIIHFGKTLYWHQKTEHAFLMIIMSMQDT